jgi:uncharacterized protein YndB with AHSA1/START domain
MFPVVVAVEIDRPIDVVFAFLTDLRNDHLWWPGVERAERIKGGGGKGSVYTQDTRLLGRRFTATMTVIEYDRPHRAVLRTDDSLTPFTAIYTFDRLAIDRTRFTMTAEVAARGVFRVLGPLLAPVLRGLARRYFRRIRAVCP